MSTGTEDDVVGRSFLWLDQPLFEAVALGPIYAAFVGLGTAIRMKPIPEEFLPVLIGGSIAGGLCGLLGLIARSVRRSVPLCLAMYEFSLALAFVTGPMLGLFIMGVDIRWSSIMVDFGLGLVALVSFMVLVAHLYMIIYPHIIEHRGTIFESVAINQQQNMRNYSDDNHNTSTV